MASTAQQTGQPSIFGPGGDGSGFPLYSSIMNTGGLGGENAFGGVMDGNNGVSGGGVGSNSILSTTSSFFPSILEDSVNGGTNGTAGTIANNTNNVGSGNTVPPVALRIQNLPRDISAREFRVLFTFADGFLYSELQKSQSIGEDGLPVNVLGIAYFRSFANANTALSTLDFRNDVFYIPISSSSGSGSNGNGTAVTSPTTTSSSSSPTFAYNGISSVNNGLPLKCDIRASRHSISHESLSRLASAPTNGSVSSGSTSKPSGSRFAFANSSGLPTNNSLEMPPPFSEYYNEANNGNNNGGGGIFSPTSPRSIFPLSQPPQQGQQNQQPSQTGSAPETPGAKGMEPIGGLSNLTLSNLGGLGGLSGMPGMANGIANGLSNGLSNGLPNGLSNGLPNGLPNGLSNGLPNAIGSINGRASGRSLLLESQGREDEEFNSIVQDPSRFFVQQPSSFLGFPSGPSGSVAGPAANSSITNPSHQLAQQSQQQQQPSAQQPQQPQQKSSSPPSLSHSQKQQPTPAPIGTGANGGVNGGPQLSPPLLHQQSFEGRGVIAPVSNGTNKQQQQQQQQQPTQPQQQQSTQPSQQIPPPQQPQPTPQWPDKRRTSSIAPTNVTPSTTGPSSSTPATATSSAPTRQFQNLSISGQSGNPTASDSSSNTTTSSNVVNVNGTVGIPVSNTNDPSKVVVAYSPTNNSQAIQIMQSGGRVLPPANPADQNPPCNTLYVGNLPPDTSEEELKDLFSTRRGYKRLCFRTKANGPMCFVEFDDVNYATRALEELYGFGLSNSVKGGIRLSFSKNPLGVRGSNSGSSSGTSTSGNSNGNRIPPGLNGQKGGTSGYNNGRYGNGIGGY